MDWLLRILGVSAKNRKIVAKAKKIVKTVTPSKPVSSVKSNKQKINDNLIIDLEDLPHDDYEIVGEANYQSALQKHAGLKTEAGVEYSCEVFLVCEDNNKYDNNAVRIELGGDTVGYLSRDDAKSFRELLEEENVRAAKVRAPARVTGGWKHGKDEGHYGIALDLD